MDSLPLLLAEEVDGPKFSECRIPGSLFVAFLSPKLNTAESKCKILASAAAKSDELICVNGILGLLNLSRVALSVSN